MSNRYLERVEGLLGPKALALGLTSTGAACVAVALVTLQASLAHPQVATLLALLRSAAWQQALDAIPGYAAHRGGEVLSLRKVLPWWNYRKPKIR